MKNTLVYGSPEPSFLEEIAELSRTRTGSIVVVVPDQFKLETEQSLLAATGRPLLHVKVMSLTGVARKILSAEDLVPISHAGRRLFLIKILSERKEELRIFGRHIHKQSFISELGSILADMTAPLALKDDVLPSRELSDKIHDINLLYDAYTRISNKYIGDEKLIGLAAKSAAESIFVKESAFFIMHYDFFTDNEHALYLTLLEHAKSVRMSLLYTEAPTYAYTRRLLQKIPSGVTVTERRQSKPTFYERFSESVFSQNLEEMKTLLGCGLHSEQGVFGFSEDSPLEVYELETRYDEAQFAADRIRELLKQGVKASEITIVTPNRDAYESTLEHVLSRARIPFFLDSDRVFHASPLARFIEAWMDYRLSPNHKNLSAMLASGVFPVPANRALKLRIAADENRMPKDDELEQILHTLRFQIPESTFSVGAFVKELYRVLTAQVTYGGRTLSVAEQCEKHSLALRSLAREATAEIEYGVRIWNAFMAVLSELNELSDISGDIDFSIARLLIDFQAVVARVPNQKEYITVTSPGRIRPARAKYCFVMGALRGELPATAGGTSVLALEEQDSVRDVERITALPDYEKEIYQTHLLLIAPEKKLILTYPSGNCSVLLTYISEAFGRAKFPKRRIESVAHGEAHLARRQYRLSAEREPEAYHFSQSKIQTYLSCPFKYFIQYVVKAREERPNEISPMDSGNLIHKILELYVNRHHADLKNLSLSEAAQTIRDGVAICRDRIARIYQEISGDDYVTADVRSNPLYQKRFIDACTLYAQAVEFHIAAGMFEVSRSEGKIRGSAYFSGDFREDFEAEFPELFEEDDAAEMPMLFTAFMNRGNGKDMPVHLEGTFDRMDCLRGAYRIVDYKTSDRYGGEVEKFLNLEYIQLGLYAYILSLQQSEDSGMNVADLRCEGLQILNLVDMFDPKERKSLENSLKKNDIVVGLFQKMPMQGIVDLSDESQSHHCREEAYAGHVIRSRREDKYSNYGFSNAGTHTAEQRELMKRSLFEAFREAEGVRESAGEKTLPQLLKRAGEIFFAEIGEGIAGGTVEFDLLVLWARLITWTVAKCVASGEFQPDTRDEKVCGYCHYKAMCRYELENR
ncbi:MAG: PD-(D/E)XK nuclease family protein [Bacillota bacterium]|nr:PD-(D/E)XK nuclease family protein [Bacillota bacterium]